MKSLLLLAIILSSLPAEATPRGAETPLWCITGEGRACAGHELADPVGYRQMLIFPTGFSATEEQTFRAKFQAVVEGMTRAPGPVYSQLHPSRILYLGAWVPGGALNTPEALFGGAVVAHPIRGKALTLRQNEVFAEVDRLRAQLPELEPIGVALVYNTLESPTANASPPSFLGRSYGVARFTVGQVNNGSYVATHELAHAALNFVDEYVESGFEKVNIGLMDLVTPLAQLNGTWSGFIRAMGTNLGSYRFAISEILAANGNDNVDTTRYVSRVATPGYAPDEYEFEGGMFFGRGTWHDAGKNIMNSHRSDDDTGQNGFAYAHSPSQARVVRTIFEDQGRPLRPNDRIRASGPMGGGLNAEWGSRTRLLIFDGDKNHRWQPTQAYDVQLGWYERRWKTCKAGGWFPYPCREDTWQVMEKRVAPRRAELELKTSGLLKLARVVQKAACHLGLGQAGPIDLCVMDLELAADAFLPTLKFPLPYEEVDVPLGQSMTNYYWRFRTDNGAWTSGWTAWSEFRRAL
ncbi:MAG: hypothetical protein IT285_15825 [Bdellovibrionales bacterium]|nr:hypothetical protein [Bdellovibrionales bacterium]